MPEKIVICPRCGKEICVSIEVLGSLVSINQEEEGELSNANSNS